MAASIYHLTSRRELEQFLLTGELAPPSLETEGFVHCCFLHQIQGVVARFFGDARGLVLLDLGDPLRKNIDVRYEPAPDSSLLFPHVYGPLELGWLREWWSLDNALDRARLPKRLRHERLQQRLELSELERRFDWYEHPEGPLFVETRRDAHRTSGHWLFLPGAISAFHRVLNNEELWVAQRGALLVHELDPDGAHRVRRLGLDVAAGELPVLAVRRGTLQAAELPPGEPFAFGTNVCAPAFDFAQFELTPRADLLARFPAHRALVERLTHGPA